MNSGTVKWSVAVLPENENGLCDVIPIPHPAPDGFVPPVFCSVRREQVKVIVKIIFDIVEHIEEKNREISA